MPMCTRLKLWDSLHGDETRASFPCVSGYLRSVLGDEFGPSSLDHMLVCVGTCGLCGNLCQCEPSKQHSCFVICCITHIAEVMQQTYCSY